MKTLHEFLCQLNRIKMQDDIFYVCLSTTPLYGFDEQAFHHTCLTDNPADAGKGLTITNRQHLAVHHVCVDGGMVSYGLEDYIGDGGSHHRFDSMIFTDTYLWLVEYKMDVQTDKDKYRWGRFSDGMNEIKEYFLYLKERLQQDGDNLNEYYDIDHIVPFICMEKLPALDIRPNTQRLTEMEKFRQQTGGLKIKYGTQYTLS